MKMSGYCELVLGAAPTASEVESNSFNIRQRQLCSQVDVDGGFSFVAGQTWSLITLNRAGIALRAEWIPLTIDAQYVVGYNWTRQFGARVTQTLSDGKVWVAASVENPETTLNVVNPPPGVLGFHTGPNATSPSSQIAVNTPSGANGVSTDLQPSGYEIAFFLPSNSRAMNRSRSSMT